MSTSPTTNRAVRLPRSRGKDLLKQHRGGRRKPSPLGEANQVGRQCHANFVPSAQQLTADSGAGLDIAASSMHCEGKNSAGEIPEFQFAIISAQTPTPRRENRVRCAGNATSAGTKPSE
jgi:hypothetical protein